MALMPLIGKISQALAGDFSEEVIVNRYGDSYAQTILPGINTSQEEWSVEWIGLTEFEATFLKNTFQAAKGNERFLWKSPLSTVDRQWTVESHRGSLMSGSGTTWEYSATFTLRY